jgi:hypothetical protein
MLWDGVVIALAEFGIGQNRSCGHRRRNLPGLVRGLQDGGRPRTCRRGQIVLRKIGDDLMAVIPPIRRPNGRVQRERPVRRPAQQGRIFDELSNSSIVRLKHSRNNHGVMPNSHPWRPIWTIIKNCAGDLADHESWELAPLRTLPALRQKLTPRKLQ